MPQVRYVAWKSSVYRFGPLWFWKCAQHGCYGGRERVWDRALARAVAHASTHVRTIEIEDTSEVSG